MCMEYDKNPFPKIDLFPSLTKLAKLGHFLCDHIRHAGLSDHNTGGGPALDAALYDQPAQLEFQYGE